MECSKNQLRVKRMKKRVKRRENGFDSKDDYSYTKVLGLKTSELEKFYFRNFVDIFNSFPLTTHLPNSNIREKNYGQNNKTMHRRAKNIVFGATTGKFQLQQKFGQSLPATVRKNPTITPVF